MVGALYWTPNRTQRQHGFTLIELMLVMSITVIILSMTTVSLLRPQTAASLTGTVETLITDMRSQQVKAMSGGTQGSGSASSYGVYIQGTQYTLFKGATYSAGDPDNYVVGVTQGVTLATSFSGSTIVFSQGSGDIASFSGSANTVTVSNTAGSSKVLTFDRYGAVSIP